MRTKNQPATTTKVVRTNVKYVIVDKVGFYDIIAKIVDGREIKRFKQRNF
jgi:hypothetical protein